MKWPMTVVFDRYSGVYSGGAWTAWPLHPWDVPGFIEGSDGECMEGWADYDKPCGVGPTAQIAISVLKDKLDRQKLRSKR